MTGKRTRVVICGAAGRDFHNFNVVYRADASCEVVAFTATQIPGIDARTYPAVLAGPLYPDGIPVVAEQDLEELIAQQNVEEVEFAYSDIDASQVLNVASRAMACGASFKLLGPRATMLPANRPVLAVCAVRTGCGKSQVTRFLATQLHARGVRTAVVRHPMPYGDLNRQTVQRFADIEDLAAADCTLEEREEYEPHIRNGSIVFAGTDYAQILAAAEAEADLILWDGGNNDFPFFRPDFTITLVDALRPEQLESHYPGGVVLRMADLIIVSKTDAASTAQVDTAQAGLQRLVPDIPYVLGRSPVRVESPERLLGARVLVVEDGPTTTHGSMAHGAGYQALQGIADVTIVDPRDTATPQLMAVFERYPHIANVLPAMGYSASALSDLAATINAADIDYVVAGTPIDLAGVVDLSVPVVRVHYDYEDAEASGLMQNLEKFLSRCGF